MTLKEFFAIHNLSSAAAAADLGIALSSMCRILDGSLRPSSMLAHRLASYTNHAVSAEDILNASPRSHCPCCGKKLSPARALKLKEPKC